MNHDLPPGWTMIENEQGWRAHHAEAHLSTLPDQDRENVIGYAWNLQNAMEDGLIRARREDWYRQKRLDLDDPAPPARPFCPKHGIFIVKRCRKCRSYQKFRSR